MSEPEGQERRGYFRIDDEVALSYRLVSADENKSSDVLRINENDSVPLANELEKMREVSRIHFRHVEKESPEAARYFTFIEKKIDLLAHHIMLGANDLFIKNTQSVSISGSGLAFTASESLSIGDLIELKFILKPSLTSIQTFSKVVSCHAQDGQFKVAVEYSQLTDDDRDLLIRHVVKKQMNDIREHKD
ncbi:MAG: PilZ domain-containing protein [Cycloclasticus sp.]